MALPSDDHPQAAHEWIWDPSYLVSLRELWAIFGFFAVMLAWTICVSYGLGYPADRAAPVELWWGVPKWFVIGVAAPWSFATLVSIAFALWWMTDNDVQAEAKAASQGASPQEPAP